MEEEGKYEYMFRCIYATAGVNEMKMHMEKESSHDS